MTPKFRPFAFRRLLIAAAGASLAFSAVPAIEAATLYWAGASGNSRSDGIWDGIGISKTFTTSSVINPGSNTLVTYNNSSPSDVIFQPVNTAIGVTVSGASPSANSITISAASTSTSAATVGSANITMSGGSLYGGTASVNYFNVQSYLGRTSTTTNGVTTWTYTEGRASLTLNNINYYNGVTAVAGDLVISNGRALGAIGAGNYTEILTNGFSNPSYVISGSITLTGNITTEAEELRLTGSGAGLGSLVNASGNNIYSGVVKLNNSGGDVLISAASGSSLQFSNRVSDDAGGFGTNAYGYMGTNPASYSKNILKIMPASGSTVTFSGGLSLGSTNSANVANSLEISSFSSSNTGGTVVIESAPLEISNAGFLTVGGGATLNLNVDNPNLKATIVLGDIYGSGTINANATNSLQNISGLVINSGDLKAGHINFGSTAPSVYLGTGGTLELTEANLTLDAKIQNQNTTTNALNFSATTGTITLSNGLGIDGQPAPGSTHFGSNAIIGSISNLDGSVSGHLIDGAVVVEGNLGFTDIAGGDIIVKGDLYRIQTPMLGSPSVTFTAVGVIGNTDGIPVTELTVLGNASVGGIVGGNISVVGNLSVYGYSGYYGTFSAVVGSVTGADPVVAVGGNMKAEGILNGTISTGGNLQVNQISGGDITVNGKLTDNSDGTVGVTINGGTINLNGTNNLINEMSGTDTVLNLNGANSATEIKTYNWGAITFNNQTAGVTIDGGDILSGRFAGVGLSIETNPYKGVLVRGSLNSTVPSVFKISALVDGISGGTVEFRDDSSLTTMTGGTASIASGKVLTVLGRQSAGVISGDGSLKFNVTTPGTYYTLSGNNTYTGGTDLQSGILCVGSNTALGTGTLTIEGGGLASASTTTNTLNNHVEVVTNFSLGDVANNGSLTLAGTVNLNGSVRTITANSDVTISGVISNGGINKVGAGKLTLSGLNTYIGGTTITEGTLAGTTDNLVGSIALTSGTALEISQSTAGTFTGIVSGAGALGKSGSGRVTLTGLNDYTGGTYVSGGTLAGTAANIRGNITTSGAGVLELSQTGTTAANFTGTFSGTGTVSKVGDGTLNFTGTQPITTGGLSVTAGTLNTQSKINASGAVTVSSGAVLNASGGMAAGSLNVTSSSFTVANGVNVSAGTVSINGGTLTNNGIIAGLVTIGSTGTLKGSGTISGGVTVNGGRMDIGNSPSILTLSSGNHSQIGGTFISEIGGTTPGTGNGFHDQYIISNGTFAISGSATLQLKSWFKADGTTTFVPVRGDSFKVINASGGLTGNFTTLTNNLDPSQIIVFAQHTGVAYATGLTTSQTFGDYTSDAAKKSIYDLVWNVGVTSGGSASAKFIDGATSNGQLAVAIIKNTAINFTDFSPESYFGLSDYAVTVTRAATDAALNQPSFFKSKRWSVGADYNIVNNTFKGGSSSAFDRSLTSQTGFVAVNYDISDDSTVGFFAGFNSGKTSTNSTRFDYDGMLLGVTGNFHFNTRYPFNLKAAFTNSDLNFDASRSLLGVSGAATLTNQKIKESSLSLQAEIETMRRNRAMVYATLGFTYDNFSMPTMIENGASTALKIDALNQNFMMGSAGVAVKYYKSTKVTYDVSAKLEKSFGGGSLKSKYVGATGTTSTLDNPSGSQTVLALGGGLTYKVNASTVFLAGLELRGSSDYTGDARLNASYRKKF